MHVSFLLMNLCPVYTLQIWSIGGKRQTKTSYTPRIVKPTNIKAVVAHGQVR